MEIETMSNVRVSSGTVKNLLPEEGVTGNFTGSWVYKDSPWGAIQASVEGTGAVGATITLQVTNDINRGPVNTAMGTIALTGASPQSDGFSTVATWKYVRAVVSGVSGTGATVYATLGL